MPRTEEQNLALEDLAAAIERTTRAFHYHEGGEVNGEFVVVVQQQSISEDDEIENGYAMLFRNAKISTMNAVGMLDVAAFDLKMSNRQVDGE